MATRTSRTTVTFKMPFTLRGVGQVPAGTYTVETDEDLLLDVSFPAYRRSATIIFLPSSDGRQIQMLTIDPLELAAAQKLDAGEPATV